MRRRAIPADTRNMVTPRTASTPLHRTAALLAVTVLAVSILAVRSPVAHGGPTHEVTEFTLPVDGSSPFAISTGPDGALWFTARGTDSVGSLATDGTFGPSAALATTSDPTAITAGPDGAVWFTEQGSGLIGRVATDGTLTEFFLPSDGAGPAGIVTGPDGALWFTERSAHRVARMATDGTTVEFELPTPVAGPVGIALGSDGNLWFTEQRANQIGRITTDGIVTEYPVPVASSLPTGIAAGPDGALWFTMRTGNRIGRIDTAGNVTTFAIPTDATDPTGIAAGWDGALWFTEPDTDGIGRITTGGTITEFALPNIGSSPFGITGGPDDAVWFTEGNGNRIGRLGAVEAPIDTTAPTISITSPVEGSVFEQGQQIVARYGCGDEAGGSGLATCAGPVIDGQAIDTSIGSHRFEVSASDVQGNRATASTGYIVFSDVGGSLTTPTIQRAGFWETLDLGLGLTRPADPQLFVAPGYPRSQQVSCADPSQVLGEPELADVKLQLKQGGLDVRWRTDRAWTGSCRAFVLRFTPSGWSGTDAVFVARFGTAQSKHH
jgi:virginiamycin B lyase